MEKDLLVLSEFLELSGHSHLSDHVYNTDTVLRRPDIPQEDKLKILTDVYSIAIRYYRLPDGKRIDMGLHDLIGRVNNA